MIKDGTEQIERLAVTWKGKIVVIILTVFCVYGVYEGKIDDEYVSTSSYPVAAADFILEEAENGNIDLDSMRIYNDYNYGSYLLFRGIPVFIDSRADLYSPEFNEDVDIFSDYMDISSIGTYYETAFEKYNITHVILYDNSKLNMFISRDDNYKMLYEDKNFVVYERLSAFADNGEE